MLVSSLTRRILRNFSTSHSMLPEYDHLNSSQSISRSLTLHQYRHHQTGARIYHFENSDPDRTQASIIKTYPKNNKGAPHILQHLACCGSHKYPIRDPFFNMIKRSVNSYMNAWTGDDFTAYPFASPNPKDWMNLYHVYLDMTLRPLLNPLDFRQEGWRFEIDQEGKKTLKGIVLNEMKGAYQDSDRQLMMALNEGLMKGTPYGYDSGGKPDSIVSLEYDELVDLHRHYYHPSNMSFYYYGKGDIYNELQLLNDNYLKNYQNKSQKYKESGIKPTPVEARHIDIRTYTSECNNCSISYLLGFTNQINAVETMTLKVISYLLLDKATSEIYKNFIQSDIAQSIGFSGLNQGKFTTFTTTLKGIYPDYTSQQFEQQFRSMLLNLVEHGIDMTRVQQFVHQFETGLRIPKNQNGIRVLEDTLYYMNHNLDLSSYLNPNPVVSQTVQKLSDKEYMKALINKYFLNNQQVVVVRQLMAESALKQEEISSPLVVDETVIKTTQNELAKRQNEEQDNSVLPNLQLTDLVAPTRKEAHLIDSLQKNGKEYQHFHVKIDEDINFYRFVFTFDKYSEEFLKKTMLWIYSLNSTIATKTQSYRELTHNLAVNVSEFTVASSIGKDDTFNIAFEFSCLNNKVQSAFKILQELIFEPVFERERISNIFKSFANESIESIIQNPMAQCQAEGASPLNLSSFISNTYKQIKDSLNIVKQQNQDSIKEVSQRLLECPKIRLIEHSKMKNFDNLPIAQRLLDIQAQKMSPLQWAAQYPSKAVVHNYGVGFCSQQYAGPAFLSRQHAHMNLLLELLQQQYLHPRIREQNGAYGTGARIRDKGTIALSSYLDPNPQQTFAIFDQSIEEILSMNSIETSKLNEVKVMQIGTLDRIRTPQNEGVSQILKGYSIKDFIQFRQHMKEATFKDLTQAGSQFLKKDQKSRCVFGRECPPDFTEEKLKEYLP